MARLDVKVWVKMASVEVVMGRLLSMGVPLEKVRVEAYVMMINNWLRIHGITT